MSLNRRGFLGAVLALGVAPAVVRASSLMHVRPIVDATYMVELPLGRSLGGYMFSETLADAITLFPDALAGWVRVESVSLAELDARLKQGLSPFKTTRLTWEEVMQSSGARTDDAQ